MFIFDHYKLADSYSLEASSYGYESTKEGAIKGKIVQFTPEHLLQFGKTLGKAMAKHLAIEVPKNSRNGITGFKIELDFGLSNQHSLPSDNESWLRIVGQVKDRKSSPQGSNFSIF